MKPTPLVTATFCLWAGLASAQSVQDQIVEQLQDQGFNRITVQRTLLGRTRIEAFSDTLERELVFNPNTGEILRDYWEPLDDDDDDGGPRLRDPNADDDFEDEEDFEDDEEEEQDDWEEDDEDEDDWEDEDDHDEDEEGDDDEDEDDDE